MAFDKVKTLRAAEKYLELGKIPAAIREYSQVIQNEPDDFTTLNTLGDLYARVGNQPAAVSCFQRIAHHYREVVDVYDYCVGLERFIGGDGN